VNPICFQTYNIPRYVDHIQSLSPNICANFLAKV